MVMIIGQRSMKDITFAEFIHFLDMVTEKKIKLVIDHEDSIIWKDRLDYDPKHMLFSDLKTMADAEVPDLFKNNILKDITDANLTNLFMYCIINGKLVTLK